MVGLIIDSLLLSQQVESGLDVIDFLAEEQNKDRFKIDDLVLRLRSPNRFS